MVRLIFLLNLERWNIFTMFFSKALILCGNIVWPGMLEIASEYAKCEQRGQNCAVVGNPTLTGTKL